MSVDSRARCNSFKGYSLGRQALRQFLGAVIRAVGNGDVPDACPGEGPSCKLAGVTSADNHDPAVLQAAQGPLGKFDAGPADRQRVSSDARFPAYLATHPESPLEQV